MESLITNLLVIALMTHVALRARKLYKTGQAASLVNRLIAAEVPQVFADAQVPNDKLSPEDVQLVSNALLIVNRPINPFGRRLPVDLTAVDATRGHLQAVGQSQFYVCEFYRVNPYDEYPLYLYAAPLNRGYKVRGVFFSDLRKRPGDPSFKCFIRESTYLELSKAGVNFDGLVFAELKRESRLHLNLYIRFKRGTTIKPPIARGLAKFSKLPAWKKYYF